MTKVKICGITNLDDALAACDAGADALGFIFAPEGKKRNRYIEPADACRIIAQLPPMVTTVAVCVNDAPERLLEYLTFVDCVQLHGEETPETCEAVAPRAIKAFRVGQDFDIQHMLTYPARANLVDAFVPDARGGTGKICDWERAREAVALDRPLILAGGLTPENVSEAVRIVQPYAVDTSGGVEAAPGKKDHERIRQFIQNVHAPLS